MSERLTERNANGTAKSRKSPKSSYMGTVYVEMAEIQTEILNRLCELEDKICEGRMVELPCKIGDTIWQVWASGSDFTQIQRGVRAIKVDLIYINQYDTIFHCISEEMTGHIPLSDFGKTVFLDRAAAEAKVLEMEGDNNE